MFAIFSKKIFVVQKNGFHIDIYQCGDAKSSAILNEVCDDIAVF